MTAVALFIPQGATPNTLCELIHCLALASVQDTINNTTCRDIKKSAEGKDIVNTLLDKIIEEIADSLGRNTYF